MVSSAKVSGTAHTSTTTTRHATENGKHLAALAHTQKASFPPKGSALMRDRSSASRGHPPSRAAMGLPFNRLPRRVVAKFLSASLTFFKRTKTRQPR